MMRVSTRLCSGAAVLLVLGLMAHGAAADSIDPDSFQDELFIGDSVTIDKTVTVTEDVTTAKVDVFFLTDSTGSMGGAINAVKTAASDVLTATAALGNVAFGVGEYRDIFDVFTYRLNQDITTNQADVQTGINAWAAGGGGDFFEANLFALEQVATTTSWRPSTTRILIWFGDAPGHDPRNGSTEASATAALVTANVVVQAIDVANGGGINGTGQAQRIADATGGGVTETFVISSDDIVTIVANALVDVFEDYEEVSLAANGNLPGVEVETSPPILGEFSREAEETFDFEVTFTCLEEGVHDFEIDAMVDGGTVATESDRITCIANQPPDCSMAGPSQDQLWPPNHKLTMVSVEGVTDPDGDPVTITITDINQDEPTDTVGDGTSCPDGFGVGGAAAAIRAERTGNPAVPGDGRVYQIEYLAEDGQGGECASVVHVCVPHDQRRGGICHFGGPIYDSTVCSE